MPGFPSFINSASSSDRFDYDGLPPELAAESQAINRKQQMANYLLQQGMQPAQGQMVGGWYVPASPVQGLSGMLQAGLGVYGNMKADEARKGVGDKSKAMLAEAMQTYKEASDPVTREGPRPTAQVMPPPQNLGPHAGLMPQPDPAPSNIELSGPGAPVQVARPPEDRRQAMVDLMLNSHPQAQRVGNVLLGELDKSQAREDQQTFMGEQRGLDRQNRTDTATIGFDKSMQLALAMGANRETIEKMKEIQETGIKRMEQAGQDRRDNVQPLVVPDPKSTTGYSYMDARNKNIISAAPPPAEITKATAKGSVAEQAVDREFAKEYIDFNAAGGYADVQKSLRQLQIVADKLDKKNLTGPITGRTPDWIRGFTNPESIAMRDTVEEVVQRNLRLILGGQFAQLEGAQLIKRAYNENQPESENKQRVVRLMTQMKEAAQAKADASKYFQEHGTLTGWKGRLWRMGDFLPEGPDGAKSPAAASSGLTADESAELQQLKKKYGR